MIKFSRDVEKDLRRVPAYYRAQVLDAIESELSHQPTTQTRNRKMLASLAPPWDAEPPVWELRVGDYRVFYDVSQKKKTIYVRAVTLKPHGRRTEDIL